MTELGILRPVDMRFVGEEVVHLRALAHDRVELVQRRAELLLDEGLQRTQTLQGCLVEAEVVQTARDIMVLAGGLRGWLHSEGYPGNSRKRGKRQTIGAAVPGGTASCP
jgi:hypothetical protein